MIIDEVINLKSTLKKKRSNATLLSSFPANLTFEKDYIIGSESVPVSGNLPAISTTGAKEGTNILIIHNSSSEPTYPTDCVIWEGVYKKNIDNYITLTYFASDNIKMSILQKPTVPNSYIDVSRGTVARMSFDGSGANGTGATLTAGGSSTRGFANWFGPFYENRTTTAIDTGNYIAVCNTSGGLNPTLCSWVAKANIGIPVIADASNDYLVFAGFHTTGDNIGEQANGFGVFYRHTVNSGKFQFRFGNAAVVADTGVTVAINTKYEIQMQYDLATDVLLTFVNGVLVNTQATASVNMANTTMRMVAGIRAKAAVAANRSLYASMGELIML